MRHIAIGLIIVLLICAGCTNTDTQNTSSNERAINQNQLEEMPRDSMIAVVYSSEGEGSEIQWLDSNLEVLGVSNLPGNNLGSNIGFQNTEYYDGGFFLIAQGNTPEENIVFLIPKEGPFREIQQGRINPTSWDASSDVIAIAGNYNWKSYIDLINIKDGSIQSIDAPDESFVNAVAVGRDCIYGISEDLKKGAKYHVSAYSVSDKRAENLIALDSKETPCFIQEESGKLFLIDNGNLLVYDTGTSSVETVKLTRQDGFNIRISGERLWIAYTNIHEDKQDSIIECRDLTSLKVLCSTSIDDAVMELEPVDNSIYVLGNDMLYEFLIADNEMVLKNKVKCERDGMYTACIAVTDRGGSIE